MMVTNARKLILLCGLTFIFGVAIGILLARVIARVSTPSLEQSLVKQLKSIPVPSPNEGGSVDATTIRPGARAESSRSNVPSPSGGRPDPTRAYQWFDDVNRWCEKSTYRVVNGYGFVTKSSIGQVSMYVGSKGAWGTICCIYEEGKDGLPPNYAVVITEGAGPVELWPSHGLSGEFYRLEGPNGIRWSTK